MSAKGGGLRIHFTRDDLARVRLADAPDPMWEAVNSLHLLQHRQGAVAFGAWRAQVRRALADGGADERALRTLLALAPNANYCPDFLTPAAPAADPEEGIENVLSTPRPRIRRELDIMAARVGAPTPPLPLAEGGAGALKALGDALRTYRRGALAPYWNRVRDHVQADLHGRLGALRSGGSEGLLSSLAPTLRWRPPVLEADYPFDREVRLGGRGLLLVPSLFCWARPVMPADPALPPVLVYPVDRAPDWARPPDRTAGLEPLLGPTRARLLELVGDGGGRTTTGLAGVAAVSPATVSKHLNVLRNAGLIRTRHEGRRALHSATGLGRDLLERS